MRCSTKHTQIVTSHDIATLKLVTMSLSMSIWTASTRKKHRGNHSTHFAYIKSSTTDTWNFFVRDIFDQNYFLFGSARKTPSNYGNVEHCPHSPSPYGAYSIAVFLSHDHSLSQRLANSLCWVEASHTSFLALLCLCLFYPSMLYYNRRLDRLNVVL